VPGSVGPDGSPGVDGSVVSDGAGEGSSVGAGVTVGVGVGVFVSTGVGGSCGGGAGLALGELGPGVGDGVGGRPDTTGLGDDVGAGDGRALDRGAVGAALGGTGASRRPAPICAGGVVAAGRPGVAVAGVRRGPAGVFATAAGSGVGASGGKDFDDSGIELPATGPE